MAELPAPDSETSEVLETSEVWPKRRGATPLTFVHFMLC